MISVIICTHNSERALVPTLASLVAGAADGVVREVIVADGGSTDSTGEIADLAGCELLRVDAPLGTRLKEAVGRAKASWLMFLQPGVVLDAGWTDDVARFIAQAERRASPEARAAIFRLVPLLTATRSPWAEGLAMIRMAFLVRPSPEQGLLINKQFYNELGGHRSTAADTQADLLSRIGRKRMLSLRSGATRIDS